MTLMMASSIVHLRRLHHLHRLHRSPSSSASFAFIVCIVRPHRLHRPPSSPPAGGAQWAITSQETTSGTALFDGSADDRQNKSCGRIPLVETLDASSDYSILP
ncbi:hypothetical protein E4U43_003942 [Claviceps pusilla]|uniref:Uncharacterized protein n=1 Tax=Claviceps pusilla TaxID=123648 RepID=A0A9P7NHP4_9HYPO|nr:hypothetical protein E4U43_003942 [Claviceps pusilla]